MNVLVEVNNCGINYIADYVKRHCSDGNTALLCSKDSGVWLSSATFRASIRTAINSGSSFFETVTDLNDYHRRFKHVVVFTLCEVEPVFRSSLTVFQRIITSDSIQSKGQIKVKVRGAEENTRTTLMSQVFCEKRSFSSSLVVFDPTQAERAMAAKYKAGGPTSKEHHNALLPSNRLIEKPDLAIKAPLMVVIDETNPATRETVEQNYYVKKSPVVISFV